MTDQTAPLRDRIAAALYERERPPREPAWVDAYPADREVFEAMADAVLAVLPPPVPRADVLREAADRLSMDWGGPDHEEGMEEARKQLRRMADETATTETQAANETPPPGGYAHRVCRHCWTGIHWTNGQWAHPDEPRGHTPEPPSLPVEPAAGARQDGARP